LAYKYLNKKLFFDRFWINKTKTITINFVAIAQ
jgi:hypothetical protein